MSIITVALIVFALAAPFSIWFYGKFFAAFARGETHARTTDFQPNHAIAAVAVVGCLLGIVVLSIFSDSGPLTLSGIIFGSLVYAFLAFVLLSVNILKDNNPFDLYGLDFFNPKQAILWVLAILPIVYLVQEGCMRLFGEAPQEVIAFIIAHRDPATLGTMAFLVIVVAPCVEEFIFRGFLYGVTSRYLGRYAGMFLTAFLFAAIHVNLTVFLPLFILAVFLTLAYERTGSLWTPIVMHATFNALAFSMLVWFPELAQ